MRLQKVTKYILLFHIALISTVCLGMHHRPDYSFKPQNANAQNVVVRVTTHSHSGGSPGSPNNGPHHTHSHTCHRHAFMQKQFALHKDATSYQSYSEMDSGRLLLRSQLKLLRSNLAEIQTQQQIVQAQGVSSIQSSSLMQQMPQSSSEILKECRRQVQNLDTHIAIKEGCLAYNNAQIVEFNKVLNQEVIKYSETINHLSSTQVRDHEIPKILDRINKYKQVIEKQRLEMQGQTDVNKLRALEKSNVSYKNLLTIEKEKLKYAQYHVQNGDAIKAHIEQVKRMEDALTKTSQVALGVVEGVGHGIADSVRGTYNLVRHPIESAIGIKDVMVELYRLSEGDERVAANIANALEAFMVKPLDEQAMNVTSVLTVFLMPAPKFGKRIVVPIPKALEQISSVVKTELAALKKMQKLESTAFATIQGVRVPEHLAQEVEALVKAGKLATAQEIIDSVNRTQAPFLTTFKEASGLALKEIRATKDAQLSGSSVASTTTTTTAASKTVVQSAATEQKISQELKAAQEIVAHTPAQNRAGLIAASSAAMLTSKSASSSSSAAVSQEAKIAAQEQQIASQVHAKPSTSIQSQSAQSTSVAQSSTTANWPAGYKGPHGTYVGASYHHPQSRGVKSKGPRDGQAALDNSFAIKKTSENRVAIQDGEFVKLYQTSPGKYHGFIVPSWGELDGDSQNCLQKLGIVNKRGKMLKV